MPPRIKPKRLCEASGLARIPSSPSGLCPLDRAHMGSVPSAGSLAQLRTMTPALSLPFLCIKQSTKQCQAKELRGLPFRC